VTNLDGISPIHKQQLLNYAVLLNLLSRVCVRILTFCVNFISDSHRAIQPVNLYQSTNQHFTPTQITHSAQSVSHLHLIFEDS